jgi:hypothetical protein
MPNSPAPIPSPNDGRSDSTTGISKKIGRVRPPRIYITYEATASTSPQASTLQKPPIAVNTKRAKR